MRLKVKDIANVVDLRLELICKWLASQFHQVKGERILEIRKTRKHRYYGYCLGKTAQVVINWKSKEYPLRIKDHRFSNANVWKEDYEVNNVYELFVSIAGHELAHMQKSPKRMRKSRKEAFCNRRAKELVDLFRSESVSELIEKETESRTNELEKKHELAQWKETPDGKMESLEKRKQVWEKKLKRAQNAIKKIEKKIKYYQKKAVQSKSETF